MSDSETAAEPMWRPLWLALAIASAGLVALKTNGGDYLAASGHAVIAVGTLFLAFQRHDAPRRRSLFANVLLAAALGWLLVVAFATWA